VPKEFLTKSFCRIFVVFCNDVGNGFEVSEREELEISFEIFVAGVDEILVDFEWAIFVWIKPECISF
jgi:hypothetical protein